MGDYLTVFSSDFGSEQDLEELAECDVSAFCDLSFFHCSIHCYQGDGQYPMLMRLLDSDDMFPASEVRALESRRVEMWRGGLDLPSCCWLFRLPVPH